jgi:hypothetical protein
MADESFEDRLEEIRRHEEPRTHHLCKCRDCDPLTAWSERAEVFEAAMSLLRKGEWHADDQPSVRETMLLADWLLYGPSDGGE